jgi:hypothetical protein
MPLVFALELEGFNRIKFTTEGFAHGRFLDGISEIYLRDFL